MAATIKAVVCANMGAVEDADTERNDGGKWLLFSNKKSIDFHWNNVVKALGNGHLGMEAKVSVKHESGDASYVICIYTRDYNDISDVLRVLIAIRKYLGYKTSRLNCKTNIATYDEANGKKN